MILRRALLPLMLTSAIAISGACTSDDEDDPDELPAADELLSQSADTAAGITSTHFLLGVEGTVASLPVQRIEGELTVEGGDVAAKGTVVADMIEGDFVLLGDTFYIKGATGGYVELPAATVAGVYDFGGVLDPDRGVAALIRSMSGAKTVGTDDIDGTDTYRIDGTVERDVIATLVPNPPSDADVTLWVSQDDDRMPVRATATFAGGESDDGGTVTVTLSDVNEPVTVEPPA